MMRVRNTPWESASLVLAVPFVAVAVFLAGCAGGGQGTEIEASASSVQLHEGEAQGTTYSIKYLSDQRVDDAVFEGLLEAMDQAANLWLSLIHI